jgi:hypothetical protein
MKRMIIAVSLALVAGLPVLCQENRPALLDKGEHDAIQSSSGACKVGVATVLITADGPQADIAPDFFLRWWKKNAKKYPGFCAVRQDFLVKDGRNFLIAFSSNESRFSGFIPTTRTDTTTTPFNANGTVSNYYGDQWSYTASGTVTTTTTTHFNSGYTDSDVALYIRTYASSGQLIRQDGHVYSSRTGGDAANSLGYNLGSLLAASGARGHMLKKAFTAMEANSKFADEKGELKHQSSRIESAKTSAASGVPSPTPPAAPVTAPSPSPTPTPVVPNPAPAVSAASQQQREVRVEPATLPLVQPAQEEQSLGDAARHAKQHKACLELAKNNPSIICQ